jgi:hypothetical protein
MFQASISVYSTKVHLKVIHSEVESFAAKLKQYLDYHWDFRVEVSLADPQDGRLKLEIIVQKGALDEQYALKDICNNFKPQLEAHINYCLKTYFGLAEATFDDFWIEVCNDAKILNMSDNQVAFGEIYQGDDVESPVSGSHHYMLTGRYSNSPVDSKVE